MNKETYSQSDKNISIYYDGLCRLCSREINQYKKMRGSENIEFVDITEASFKADELGLDPIQVHKSLHVRDKSGSLHVGVDAFIRIWNELPAFRFLAPIARNRAIHFILRIFYAGFVKVRPLLPRKSCESSPYCEVHTKA